MLIEYEENKEMITGKCEYCGSPIKSGEKFCHSCGASNNMYNPADEAEFNVQYQIAKQEADTAKFIIIGMVVFCVVLCATVFAIFAMAM